jgi:xanthine dehydrogenase accessory factor
MRKRDIPKVARIGAVKLTAPVTGVLRGLTRDGVPVHLGTKVIEVDPRGESNLVMGIGERPARIADGVYQAVEAWAVTQPADPAAADLRQ